MATLSQLLNRALLFFFFLTSETKSLACSQKKKFFGLKAFVFKREVGLCSSKQNYSASHCLQEVMCNTLFCSLVQKALSLLYTSVLKKKTIIHMQTKGGFMIS